MIDKEKYQDKKLIAFDLYGTCITHCPNNFSLSREAVEYFKTHSISLQEAKQIIENFGIKTKIFDNLIISVKHSIEGALLFPEVLETLKYIKSKGYQTAVVSNLSKDYAEPLHRLVPQGNFDHKVLSFDVGATKPDPKIYEYLKYLSGVDFKDIIMIGDSLKSDVMGSKNVGITPIHLNRSEEGIKEVHKKGIDFIQISTLADLKEIL